MSDNNKTVSRKLKITNSGALDGEFSINYKGDLPITFVPTKDKVPAYSESYIRVDFFTNKPEDIEEKIQYVDLKLQFKKFSLFINIFLRINLDGSNKPNEFKVIANIMKRELVLLDPYTDKPINKMDFGSCYYGCNLLNMAILYNSSPEKVDYVVLLEEKGLGTEIVN